MGINNEEIFARAEEKKCNVHPDTRWGGSSRRESEINGVQQKRNDREDCSRSDIFRFGQRIAGGMLRQLIEEYKDQVATKKDAIERLASEIERLTTRIEEFESLEKQIDSTKTSSS